MSTTRAKRNFNKRNRSQLEENEDDSRKKRRVELTEYEQEAALPLENNLVSASVVPPYELLQIIQRLHIYTRGKGKITPTLIQAALSSNQEKIDYDKLEMLCQQNKFYINISTQDHSISVTDDARTLTYFDGQIIYYPEEKRREASQKNISTQSTNMLNSIQAPFLQSTYHNEQLPSQDCNHSEFLTTTTALEFTQPEQIENNATQSILSRTTHTESMSADESTHNYNTLPLDRLNKLINFLNELKTTVSGNDLITQFVIIYNAIFTHRKISKAEEVLINDPRVSEKNKDLNQFLSQFNKCNLKAYHIIHDRQLNTQLLKTIEAYQDRPKLLTYIQKKRKYTSYTQQQLQDITTAFERHKENKALINKFIIVYNNFFAQKNIKETKLALQTHEELTYGEAINPLSILKIFSINSWRNIRDRSLNKHLHMLAKYYPDLSKLARSKWQAYSQAEKLMQTKDKKKEVGMTQIEINAVIESVKRLNLSSEQDTFVIVYNTVIKYKKIQEIEQYLQDNHPEVAKEINKVSDYLRMFGLCIRKINRDRGLNAQLRAAVAKNAGKPLLATLGVYFKEHPNTAEEADTATPNKSDRNRLDSNTNTSHLSYFHQPIMPPLFTQNHEEQSLHQNFNHINQENIVFAHTPPHEQLPLQDYGYSEFLGTLLNVSDRNRLATNTDDFIYPEQFATQPALLFSPPIASPPLFSPPPPSPMTGLNEDFTFENTDDYDGPKYQ